MAERQPRVSRILDITTSPDSDGKAMFTIDYETRAEDIWATLAYLNPDPNVPYDHMLLILHNRINSDRLRYHPVKAIVPIETAVTSDHVSARQSMEFAFAHGSTRDEIREAFDRAGEGDRARSQQYLNGFFNYLFDGLLIEPAPVTAKQLNEFELATDEAIGRQMVAFASAYYRQGSVE